MRVVGCFLTYGDTFVLFHRHAHKPDGNTWGLPGGKVEPDESDIDAIIRELGEETGYIGKPSEFELLGVYEFESPNGHHLDYVTYALNLDKPHKVTLEESAHSKYKWVTVEEADKMNDLIYGLHELFRMIRYL